MIFSLRRWSSLIHAGFHVSRATRVPARPPSEFRIRGYHPLWPAFPDCSATPPDDLYCRPHYPKHLNLSARFRLLPFRSPLLRESLLLSFPPGTEMFHFPGFAPNTLTVLGDWCSHQPGCPIRKSTDHRSFSSSPWLIAAYHVLLRSPLPRHPPYALSSLTLTL